MKKSGVQWSEQESSGRKMNELRKFERRKPPNHMLAANANQANMSAGCNKAPSSSWCVRLRSYMIDSWADTAYGAVSNWLTIDK